MKKFTKKVTLTAMEISEISMCLREVVRRAKMEDNEDAKEYIEKIKKLQQKFQRLAVKVEKEVLEDIRVLNSDK